LLQGLPSLAFCDVASGQAQLDGQGSRSSINRAEAQLAVRLVQALLTANSAAKGVAEGAQQDGDWQDEEEQAKQGTGLLPEDIGVICFFRAQAALIHKMLNGGEITTRGGFLTGGS
jgi:hypothetical protein